MVADPGKLRFPGGLQVLLGADWLAKSGAIIDFGLKEMYLRGTNINPGATQTMGAIQEKSNTVSEAQQPSTTTPVANNKLSTQRKPSTTNKQNAGKNIPTQDSPTSQLHKSSLGFKKVEKVTDKRGKCREVMMSVGSVEEIPPNLTAVWVTLPSCDKMFQEGSIVLIHGQTS